MKPWADFYDFCHADVPGVLGLVAERELRRAAQEFCEKTKVWTVDLDPIFIFPNIGLYELDLPPGTKIVKVMGATLHGQNVPLLTVGEHGYGIVFTSQMTFQMQPQPQDRQQITFRVVLAPNHASTGIDDALFAQYAEQIATGAKARLYAQPQKTYTDPGLAAIEQEKFALFMAREKIEAAKGFSGAPLRIKPQFL